MAIKQLTAIELQKKTQETEGLLLLDVREPFEYQYANIAGSVLMPMNQIQQRLNELDPRTTDSCDLSSWYTQPTGRRISRVFWIYPAL